MEFLFSNYPPMKTGCKTFSDTFYGLIPQTSKLDIAVGYVSSDALLELQKILELYTNVQTLNLIIGMHYFDRFTKSQYDAAILLNDFLTENQLGGVRLVHAFRYHGKLYSYSNVDGPFAGIIGSNNLSSIVDGGVRVYENSVLFDDAASAKQMNDFISKLMQTSTKNIAELEIDIFNEENPLLDGHEFVDKVSPQDLAKAICAKTEVSFEIPIKPYEVSPASNLNAFFGKGRKSRNGLIKPRHWYEVELIVPVSITRQQAYPKKQSNNAIFTVITDDGWSFKCKVSGDDSKNLRSEGDLKILGKWLKGRMENAGVLTVGSPVTADTLSRYGRSSFTLTQTTMPGVWFLDFEVKK